MTLKSKIIGRAFLLGVKLIVATSTIEVDSEIEITRERLFGYWHGDSLGMIVLLTKINTNKDYPTNIIVTADWRGDVIEYILDRIGGNAIRVENGVGMRNSMKDIMRKVKDKNEVFAMSIDGPAGPAMEPKGLIYKLSDKSHREAFVADFDYKRKIRLKRWDKYAIPLLFSTVKVDFIPLGKIERT